MDPKATLIAALEAMKEMPTADPESLRDYAEEAAEHLYNLADWLIDGGFAPNVHSADWDWPIS